MATEPNQPAEETNYKTELRSLLSELTIVPPDRIDGAIAQPLPFSRDKYLERVSDIAKKYGACLVAQNMCNFQRMLVFFPEITMENYYSFVEDVQKLRILGSKSEHFVNILYKQ